MATLDWTSELELGDDRIDETHREFVEMVNAVGTATDEQMLAMVDALIAHTEEHFGQEQRWMAATEFPPTHCHLDEHAGVLEAMRETRNYVAEGKAHVGRVLANELGAWFRSHAATMDTMLAQWLKSRQFDTSKEVAAAN
ncbi:MAG: hemerythrin domain-containing protein [Burkholderiales bacterium]|nr:hemerythrin domain-containing protein [Burkholderiales bacterium]